MTPRSKLLNCSVMAWSCVRVAPSAFQAKKIVNRTNKTI